jgi:hypothetical protein
MVSRRKSWMVGLTMTDWSTNVILFGSAAFVGKSIILTRYSLCGSSS